MNRRRFLAASGTATVTALGGCLGFLEGDGGGSDASGYDAVSRWAVPREDDPAESGGFNFLSRSASRMLELDEHVSMDLEALLADATSYEWGDVDPADLEYEIEVKPNDDGSTPYYKVFTGSLDADAARSTLEAASEGKDETHEGYDVYRGVTAEDSFDDARRVYGVGNGAVVQSGGVLGIDGTVDQLHRVVDAAEGVSDRRPDQHEALAEVTSRMELGVVSVMETKRGDQETDLELGQFQGVTARGTYGIIDADAIEMTAIHVFEAADAVDTAAIEGYVSREAPDRQFDLNSYDVDGRVVTIEGSASAQQLLSV